MTNISLSYIVSKEEYLPFVLRSDVFQNREKLSYIYSSICPLQYTSLLVVLDFHEVSSSPQPEDLALIVLAL